MEPIISTPVFLFFISSLTIFCFGQASYAEADMLVNNVNLSSKNSTNIDQDREIRTFMFSGSSSSHPSVNNLRHHSGYFPIKNTHDARMFYFFFESRGSRNDPVILWLTGGPGCSSQIALFYENGPFHINNDLSLEWNDFGWDKTSNMLYVDQPTGTGFSYSSDDRDIRHTTHEISNDLYYFLQAFFHNHPELVNNDFYIMGQSYSGHYIPVLASRLLEGNRAYEGIHINLKGFAIGNGFTDPVNNYASLTDFALSHNVISKSNYKKLKKKMPECVKSIQQCQSDNSVCEDSYAICSKIFLHILSITDDINYYDIRKKCVGESCYDFSQLENFLELDSVKRAIAVGNIEYELCSDPVRKALINVDWMKNYDNFISSLLDEGIKVLIFAGEYDLICNWLGLSRWVNGMKWSGQKQFSRAELTPYNIGGENIGQIKSFGPLTFVKVCFNAINIGRQDIRSIHSAHLCLLDLAYPENEVQNDRVYSRRRIKASFPNASFHKIIAAKNHAAVALICTNHCGIYNRIQALSKASRRAILSDIHGIHFRSDIPPFAVNHHQDDLAHDDRSGYITSFPLDDIGVRDGEGSLSA